MVSQKKKSPESVDAVSDDAMDAAMSIAFGSSLPTATAWEDDPITQVGRYKLLEQIGEGGFGVVYMAEQEAPFQRRVALKIIKLGMDTKQVVARFEAERQALAMMNHENIASVFDAGATETGRPYFVMELVRGVPITEYCDRNKLQTDERLQLFISVCKAVQHAHQKGIIHRDLKPSNVMVTLRDGMPIAKVIDFGVAKATQVRLTDKTVFTRYGQFIGTPAYMSPEQVEMSELDVDTRSDIYSLGVLLYELLAGSTPIKHEKLKHAGYSDMQRMICEQEPPRPSSRLSQSGEALASISAQRATEPKKLGQILRGDLDWIVMKALDKDRTRRYSTVGGFSDDVLRYLRGDPVTASPPGKLYLAKKLFRRHYVSILFASFLITILIAGIIGTSIGLIQARLAKTQADNNAEEARLSGIKAEEATQVALHQSYRANTNAGAIAHAAHQPFAARQYLLSASKHLRGWEWYYLMNQLDQCTSFARSSEPIRGLQVSRDGVTYFTLETQETSKIHQWSAYSHQHQQTLIEATRITDFFLVDEDQSLLTYDGHNKLVVHDLVHGKESLTIELDWPYQTNSMDVSADGLLCLLSWPSGFCLINLASGDERRTGPLTTSISVARFHPDGKRIFVGDYDGKLAIIDIETLKVQQAWSGHGNRVISLDFDATGANLVSSSFDGTVRAWNIESDKPAELAVMAGHVGLVNKTVYSPDGQLLASVGQDRTVRMWRVDDWKPLAVFSKHDHQPNLLDFFPNSQTLITTDVLGSRCTWHAGTHRTTVLRGHESYVYPVAISPDGALIASGGWDGVFSEPECIRIWDAATGDQIATFAGDICYALTFSPRGDSFAASTQLHDGEPELRVVNSTTGSTKNLNSVDGRVVSMAYDPTGRCLATASLEGVAQITEVTTDKVLVSRQVGLWDFEKPIAVAWSSDGRRIAISAATQDSEGSEGSIAIWDGITHEVLYRWTGWSRSTAANTGNDGGSLHQRPITSVGFSPDGQRIVTSSIDSTLRVWDVETGKQIGMMVGHGNEVFCAIYSPDGKRLASGGRDNRLRIWDTATFQQVASLEGHEDYIYSLAWSKDGQRIVSGSGDSTVRVWDTQPVASRLKSRQYREEAFVRLKPAVDQVLKESSNVAEAVARFEADALLSDRDREIAMQILLHTAL